MPTNPKPEPKSKPETIEIRLLTGMGGHTYDEAGNVRNGFSKQPGSKVRLPVEEAERYIDRGYAELVDDSDN